MAEKIRFQTPYERRLKTALRELMEKTEAANMEISSCLVVGWGLPPETIEAIKELHNATLKAKEVLGEKS